MDNPVSKIAGWGLLLLATARATRFITSDYLGDWLFVRRAKVWAILGDQREGQGPVEGSNHEVDLHEGGWRSKLVSGLDCPFCVGFWIGGVILLGEATIGRSPLRPLWRFGIAMLGLNYLVGHISSRIDG